MYNTKKVIEKNTCLKFGQTYNRIKKKKLKLYRTDPSFETYTATWYGK